MIFVLSKLAWAVLRPSGLMVLLAACGTVLVAIRPGASGRSGTGLVLLLAGVGGLLATMLLPVDRWALRPLEDRFPRPPPPARVDGILVLGGAIEGMLSADRGMPSLNGAAERITEFVALSRRYPRARLAFVGGNGELAQVPSEAIPARALLDALGVAPERLAFETASRTTWENAVFARDLLRPAPGETWLLVTSASHMPRAVGAFRAAGWRVLPWPVGYKTLREGRVALPAPLGERLANLDWAAHEWLGLASYRLLGRNDTLFPGPS